MPSKAILHLTARDAAAASLQLGPYQITSLIPSAAEAAMTAYRVRVEPQQQTSVSFHLVAEEIYYVLAGSGIALLDGQPHRLQTGDFLRLPPGTRHGFITQHEALEMLDIHSPGSRPDKDVYFEGTAPAGFSATPPAD
jgi:quercetin dioxygenase-like cupin family protein